MGHIVSSAIVEKDVPSSVIASCGEEEKGQFCYVDERRHCDRRKYK